ncbi:uncharacterized protein LOC120112307 isoform X2 [Phoenix dactylifera]|uniref:Uncharacterized protein LOC120112307 isoform X2 n=1 Tax=Phoenix dactylifera TaxID=42345 RepID=A0A8B9AUR5_PHODC|nr:uncharacterized protein LOC120112307 isoform X2 [Phoenix dactylifera]
MRAALMWTINDFPAYGNMSGWPTKGYLACPICNEDASSERLRSKIGYMGARRFLPENHTWRKSKLFNGKSEDRSRPREFTGEEILEQINSGTYKPLGKHPSINKKRKRGKDADTIWAKKSILFDLPYWKTLNLRHNLDVMHIEKNIAENIVGILLGVDGKCKDTEKARMDLADMGIRKELHLKKRANGSYEKPPALYTLSLQERQGFCDFLKSIKFPEGSIAEAYISKESTTFCSMYLNGIETVFNREERNDDGGDRGTGLTVFTQSARPFGLIRRGPDVPVNELEMAEWFVLYNSSEVDQYREEHKNYIQGESEVDITNRQRKEFPKWFKDRVSKIN